MSTHSVLFSDVVHREDQSRTASPAIGLQSSRPFSMIRTANPYWGQETGLSSARTGAREYPYPQYRRDSVPSPLNGSLPNPTRLSAHYGRESESTIDFTGLIPMYDTPGTPDINARQLIDLSYEHDAWPTSNMAQYATFQRNKHTLWQSADAPSQHWSTGANGASFNEYTSAGYSPPSPYSSAASSGSMSPAYFLTPPGSAAPALPSPPAATRRGAAPSGGPSSPKKACFHCHVTTTPLWRRDPATQRPLCNACGLYLQQRNKLRPQELIDADRDDSDDELNRIPDADYTGPKCSHCLTRQTSVWRRSKTGQQVCNACGVYARLRGKERPLSLRRNKIKPRTKHSR
ncbi:hypothetical protein GGX14DRAFT_453666 [Mycena pura]|uniref:GATA-type domain-containing protein n=1 Tax=Mycena pura TaxID=153505 RepID=A0AAD6YGQ7_9AGAR|nr:hypothetical protein GGX14DRAFT_453666 [Mycena pura]